MEVVCKFNRLYFAIIWASDVCPSARRRIEKEIDHEIEFIGKVAEDEMTDDELIAALTA